VKVSIETNRWVDDHQDQAREVLGKSMGLDEGVYKTMGEFYFPRNGYQLIPSIWDTYYLMVNTGEYQKLDNPEATINDYWIKPATRFITPVVRDLGEQADPIVARALQIKLQNLPKSPETYFAPFEEASNGRP
jgi:hypothetical protein